MKKKQIIHKLEKECKNVAGGVFNETANIQKGNYSGWLLDTVNKDIKDYLIRYDLYQSIILFLKEASK